MSKKKFKVGDEIVVVKNLGTLYNRAYVDEYYHGNTVDEVPLNSVGKIVEIDGDNDYVVQLNNGYESEFEFHPREIKLLKEIDSATSVFSEFKKLNKHPLLELAKESLVFLVDGKIYAHGEENDENYFVNSKKNKKHLAPAGEASVFDNLYYEREAINLEAIQKKYITKIIKEKFSGLLDNNLDAPQLIYKNIFPHLRSVEYENKLESALFSESEMPVYEKVTVDEKQTSKKNKISLNADLIVNQVLKSVDELILRIEKERFMSSKHKSNEDNEISGKSKEGLIDKLLSYFKEKKEPSMFEKILDEKNMCIINGVSYDPVSISDKNKFANLLSIEGKKWHLSPSARDFSETQTKYLYLLSKKIRIDALKNYFTKQRIEEILHNSLNSPVSFLDEYEEEDFGFIEKKSGEGLGSYYVYLNVPEFAIKNKFNNQCYYFKKARVAIKTWLESGKLTFEYYPVMIEANYHPITYGRGNDFASMCWGQNQIPQGKDNAETVALMLKKLKEICIFGYRNTNISLFDNSFIIIKPIEELKQKGIMIVNEDV